MCSRSETVGGRILGLWKYFGFLIAILLKTAEEICSEVKIKLGCYYSKHLSLLLILCKSYKLRKFQIPRLYVGVLKLFPNLYFPNSNEQV